MDEFRWRLDVLFMEYCVGLRALLGAYALLGVRIAAGLIGRVVPPVAPLEAAEGVAAATSKRLFELELPPLPLF